MQAKDIMTTDVVSIYDDMTLEEAARILLDKDISGAPVLNRSGLLVGVLTEGDLIRTQKSLAQPLFLTFLDAVFPLNYKEINEDLQALTAIKVADLMTETIYSLGPEAEERDIADLMVQRQINRVPIVDRGALVGIVSRQDMVRAHLTSPRASGDKPSQ